MLEEVLPKKRAIVMTFNFDREDDGNSRSIKKIAKVGFGDISANTRPTSKLPNRLCKVRQLGANPVTRTVSTKSLKLGLIMLP